MDRINHVKIVSPDPEAVNRFLCEVLEVPEGWALPGSKPASQPASAARRELSWPDVLKIRGDDASGGFIAGSPESRQFQILGGPKAHIWSVAVGTRHIERAHARCRERGIPCSDV